MTDDVKRIEARLLMVIRTEFHALGLTQEKFGELVGLPQSDVSCLMTGHQIERFTIDRLVVIVSRLGYKITLSSEK